MRALIGGNVAKEARQPRRARAIDRGGRGPGVLADLWAEELDAWVRCLHHRGERNEVMGIVCNRIFWRSHVWLVADGPIAYRHEGGVGELFARRIVSVIAVPDQGRRLCWCTSSQAHGNKRR